MDNWMDRILNFVMMVTMVTFSILMIVACLGLLFWLWLGFKWFVLGVA